HRRHAEFFSTLIEASDWARTRPLVRSPDDGTDAARQAREGLLGLVEEEEGNLRAALGWAVEHGDGPQALWLAAGLAVLGFYRGHSAHERPQLRGRSSTAQRAGSQSCPGRRTQRSRRARRPTRRRRGGAGTSARGTRY